MKIKKIFAVTACAVMMTGFLTSCGGSSNKEKLAIAIEALKSETAKILNVKSQLQLPALITAKDDDMKSFEATVEWVAAPAEKWTISKEFRGNYFATPVLPDVDKGETMVDFTLTAMVKVKSAVGSREFPGRLIPVEHRETITIAAAKALGHGGDEVQVQGVIVNNYSGSGFNVCDTTGCITVYDKEVKVTPITGLTLKVKGTMGSNTKKINEVDVPCIQIIYQDHEVADINLKSAPGDSATVYTVEEIKAFKHNPTEEGYVNRAGEVIKVTANIMAYSNGGGYVKDADPSYKGYTNWEIVPVGKSTPFVVFYCNSSIKENNDAFQAFFVPFEGKKVEALIIVHDTNGSNWRFSVLDLKII